MNKTLNQQLDNICFGAIILLQLYFFLDNKFLINFCLINLLVSLTFFFVLFLTLNCGNINFLLRDLISKSVSFSKLKYDLDLE